MSPRRAAACWGILPVTKYSVIFLGPQHLAGNGVCIYIIVKSVWIAGLSAGSDLQSESDFPKALGYDRGTQTA